MLQYITQPEGDTGYSVAEQVQMFIEGGGAWVVVAGLGQDESTLRQLCSGLLPVCRESGTILTLEDHHELARELGIHGVLLSTAAGTSAVSLREQYGAEAIIGVEVASAQAIVALQGRDIDYVQLSWGHGLEKIQAIISRARQAMTQPIPVVVAGNIALGDIAAVMQAGASGIATGRPIANADDPVRATRQYIDLLKAHAGH